MWRPSESHRKRVQHYDNGEPHFLTFSCFRRSKLLSRDRSRKWLIEALGEARQEHRFHLWAWVIMPEHVHLLIWPPLDEVSTDPRSMDGRIRGILGSIKRPVASRAVSWLQQHSPEYLERLTVRTSKGPVRRFWQPGSGYDENISNLGSLYEIIQYIHANPVRRGLVRRAEDWPWSSARDWLGLASDGLSVDRTLPASLEIPWTGRRAN